MRNDFDLAGIPGNTGTLVAGEAPNTPGAGTRLTVPDVGPRRPMPTATAPSSRSARCRARRDISRRRHEVAVEGIVVGDFQTGGFDGYYVQDAGDGNAATSDGIFVFASGGAAVALGDVVNVAGAVSEFSG